MQNKSLTMSLAIIAVLAVAGVGFYIWNTSKMAPLTPTSSLPTAGDYSIASFRDCVDAGYPVTQSMPRQCRTPDGKIFVEGVDNPTTSKATAGCYIGGCSNQICSNQPGAVSDCMYKSEFVCYQTAVCEKQADGMCGWRQSSDVVSCLESAIQNK